MVDIGVISDTHALLRPEAVAALAGVVHVVHAGDVGSAAVLEDLARIAPLTAVRGNNDLGPWAERLPETARVTIARTRLLIVHDAHDLTGVPLDDVDVVVTGHSHRPSMQRCDGVLHVNPGSAGPRRFRLPIALARLRIGPHGIEGRIVDLATHA
ncbi:metallophosphatase family protein [Candidatus Binatia bacterium]|nr:metallophosphatase family protein [Candidatus Binatia bacterium]